MSLSRCARVLLSLTLLLGAWPLPGQAASSITLAWDPPTVPAGIAVTGYQVQRCTVPQCSQACTPVDVAGATVGPALTQWTDPGVTEGLAARYAVVTLGTGGLTPRSEPSATVCVLPLGLPAVATAPTATVVLGATLVSVDSVDPSSPRYKATNALDGNPLTFWHTEYATKQPPYPHTFTVALDGPRWVSGLRYVPRQEGDLTGTIATYRLEGSLDQQTWTVLAQGTWAATATPKVTRFPAVLVRYVRLVGLSEITNKPVASAAEIQVLPGTKP